MTPKQLRTLDKLELTVNQKETLKLMQNIGEPVLPTQLGKSIGLRQPTASSWANATLKALEKRKLVKKLPNSTWVLA